VNNVIHPGWTVNSTSINSIVQASVALGGDADAMLLAAGIDPDSLLDPESRHPFSAMLALYKQASQLSADVGIYVGRIEYISRMNMLLYACSVCETLREYLNLMPSILRFAGDIGETRIRRDGEYLCLDWLPLWKGSRALRYPADAVLTTAIGILGSLCVQPIPLLRAQFSYAEPAEKRLLHSVFGDNLQFGAEESRLYFDRACLDYPLIQLDSDWGRAVRASTRHLFDSADSDPVLRSLRATLMGMLPAGGVTIDRTAAAQNISRRTLQRRLAERGTQFAQVLQGLRAELALQYLADERLSITDIALLLGYADHGSFSSAFKSWYGRSPRDYRH
tara:strand:+ start:548 stop:1552 length:1005 start_codon:yes stop_codon:yes gene_type:complete